jgi:hypothetical protein
MGSALGEKMAVFSNTNWLIGDKFAHLITHNNMRWLVFNLLKPKILSDGFEEALYETYTKP